MRYGNFAGVTPVRMGTQKRSRNGNVRKYKTEVKRFVIVNLVSCEYA